MAIGHILAAEKAPSGENYILSGERMTLKKMFAILEEVTGVPGPSIYIPMGLAKSYSLFYPHLLQAFQKTSIIYQLFPEHPAQQFIHIKQESKRGAGIYGKTHKRIH